MGNNKPLSYEKRIIAFIDILGFKEIIKQSGSDPSKIELINSVLNFLKTQENTDNWDLKFIDCEDSAWYKGIKNFDIRGKTSITSFSDSIVVSVLTENNVNEMVSTLIANLAYIGAVLMEKGILIRGGLTIGKLIHNNEVVFGQGLIDAYNLETRGAKYPRIILSNLLIEELTYPFVYKKQKYAYHQYLNRFEDGCLGFHQMIFFQVMETWTEMSTEQLSTSLAKVRKVILNGLDSSFENPDVFSKYLWLKKQYNRLYISTDYDFKTKTEENVKLKIRDLNEGITLPNIHFTYINDFHDENRNL